MAYSVIERGAPNTLEYRMYFSDNSGIISPFHDIPLYANEEALIFNMVVEVPRWTNAKMEIATMERLNPIKQDTKKGKLRFVHNCFPHHGYIWNYGAFPQTWEDPSYTDEHTGQKGDKDPIDVCEIGFKIQKRGAVVQVKVLGIMALIDEGETDWKVLAIDINDPLASVLNDVDDIEKHMPGFLQATNEWFRIYKIPAGKPENKFAFNGEAKNKSFALTVIKQANDQWKQMVSGQDKGHGICCDNTTVRGSLGCLTQDVCQKEIDNLAPGGNAAPIDDEVDKWFYPKL